MQNHISHSIYSRYIQQQHGNKNKRLFSTWAIPYYRFSIFFSSPFYFVFVPAKCQWLWLHALQFYYKIGWMVRFHWIYCWIKSNWEISAKMWHAWKVNHPNSDEEMLTIYFCLTRIDTIDCKVFPVFYIYPVCCDNEKQHPFNLLFIKHAFTVKAHTQCLFSMRFLVILTCRPYSLHSYS